ncbi:MAG: DUF554 domain-containing protein [Acidobacteria bacterium]|jgi:uncharacterized membrane protein YqgA involved in biofilm formation|nr:MAG: DUF554 domain-containing protein [Acidobacteriota bacterium]
MFPGFGTLVNAGLVLFGATLGLRGSRLLPSGLHQPIMHAIGLFTLLLGLRLVYENKPELLKVFFILVVGGAVGGLLRLEERASELYSGESDFAKGFVSASLLFTVGPMTLMGCILEGTKGDSSLLISKAFMDGFSSVVLASTLGKGVLFSSIYVLFFQGSITLVAYFFGDLIERQSMNNALFLGGGLMVLTALRIWGLLEHVKTLNLMPALIIALVL